MRANIIVVGLLLAAAAAAGYAFFTGMIPFGTSKAACLHDDEIDHSTHDGASKTAHQLAEKMLLPNAAPAYAMLTPQLQKIITSAQFETVAKQIRLTGPYRAMKVEHLYQPTRVDRASSVRCGDTSDPERWVAVEAAPNVKQVHAVLTAKTKNNDWAFTFWLIDDKGSWRANAFYVSMASIAGASPAELLRRARDQEAKGHTLNAHMLYLAAHALVDRGQSFQLGIGAKVDAGLKKHKVPAELVGKPPFIWALDGKDYAIDQATILGVDGKIALLLLHRDPAWNGEDFVDAEQRNRSLVDALVKTHPEHAETFGGIIAQLRPPPGKTVAWSSVFDTTTGYVSPAKGEESASN